MEEYGIDKINVNNDRSQENNIQIKKQTIILKLSSIILFIILSIFTSNDALIMIIVILL